MNYTNGFKNIEIEITDITKNPFEVFWNFYKMTWNNLQDIKYTTDNEFIIDKCKDILAYKALPTPMETINIQFIIKNLSRVALAQITRGRVGWAFNVESQMPVPIKHNVTIPTNIFESYFKDKALKLIEDSQNLYSEMIRVGFPPQDCRFLTMHGQQTNLIVNTNYTALKQFFSRRACNSLTDELNYVCRLILKEIRNKVQLNELNICWLELIKYLDSSCAIRKTCNNTDKVFKCCGRFGKKSDDANYDFHKSAWYSELKTMPTDLLFTNEKDI